MVDWVIEFRIDVHSGVPPFRQLVHQVHQALHLGLLREGDQLPTVKEVVGQVAINPNTVLKAYRELEHQGLAVGRPGLGTFVTRSLAQESVAAHKGLRLELGRWLARARRAGLDDAAISALLESTFHAAADQGVA